LKLSTSLKLEYGLKYDVKEWLYAALFELAVKDSPLSEEEEEQIGPNLTLKMYRIRERVHMKKNDRRPIEVRICEAIANVLNLDTDDKAMLYRLFKTVEESSPLCEAIAVFSCSPWYSKGAILKVMINQNSLSDWQWKAEIRGDLTTVDARWLAPYFVMSPSYNRTAIVKQSASGIIRDRNLEVLTGLAESLRGKLIDIAYFEGWSQLPARTRQGKEFYIWIGLIDIKPPNYFGPLIKKLSVSERIVNV